MTNLPFSAMHERLAQPGSDVWEVHYDALARQEAGEDVLLLSVGDPDFDTPSYISQHVIERINAGRTHYSPAAGEWELRHTIAELESQSTGRVIDGSQVTIFPGATAALTAVVATIANSGDGIVVPEPMYIGYRGIFSALNIDVQSVPLATDDFTLNVDQLIARIQPSTKAVLVNTPGNPCGNIIPPDSLARLADVCRDRDIWMICDEVYSLITFDSPHTSLLKCTDDLSNVIVIDGLSKSHAMTGWRVGWTVTDLPMAEALERYSGATLFGVSQFIQDGAAYALAHDAQDIERMRSTYQKRRDEVMRRVAANQLLTAYPPQGGMFVMLDVSQVAENGDLFARRLLDEQGVSTIPGSGFGKSTSQFVRISLTASDDTLDAAFDRIDALTG